MSNNVFISLIYIRDLLGHSNITTTEIYARTNDELKALRDKMFAYIGNVASSISKEQEMDIYFSKNYTHVPLEDFATTEKAVDFIGEISSDTVYLNCKPGWVAPSALKDEPCSLYKIS